MGFFAYQTISKNTTNKINASPAGVALTPAQGRSGYTDIEGNPVQLQNYLGTILVVNSWASWSPQSAQELQKLAAVAQEYDQETVTVLAINRAEPKNTAQAYLASIAVADSVVLILDPQDNYYSSVGGFAMPETIFYDAQGNVVQHTRGALDDTKIKKFIEEARAAAED